MNDDWRLRIVLEQPDHALELKGYLEASEMEHDLENSLGDRIAVTYDNAEVFCYAATREQAERAEKAIRARAAEAGWEIKIDLKRWHPEAEEWEDPDQPLPSTGAEHRAEHEELIEQEREETRAMGHYEWEVRVQCRSHHDAVQLADKLEAEGVPYARRWRYVVAGAEDEDKAKALAERIRTEAPEGAVVTAEGNWEMVYSTNPRQWLSIFGGLAG